MLKSDLFYWPRAIRALLGSRRKVVMQTTRTDCGVASVLTVLNLLGRAADPVRAMEVMDPDRKGTRLNAIRNYFVDQLGLEARALKAPAGNLRELKGRVILHMSQLHYVVLLHLGRSGVMVHDPAVGAVHYPMGDFQALYSGVALEVSGRRSGETRALSADVSRRQLNAKTGSRLEPLGLFLAGAASRLLECAILLCLVAVLYLVLNQASFPSLLLAFTVIVACGALLLFARQLRFEGEDAWTRKKQAGLWRGVLRTSLRGQDLHGFRGRLERDVSGSIRHGVSVSVPQKAQLPAALGAVLIMPAALCLLHPVLGLVHLLLFGLALLVTQLDTVQVCRRSVLGSSGRYSKLTLGHDLINAVSAPDMIGETAKWTVIGFASFSVLFGSLPPVALMFWILAGMQIVPVDFRRVMLLAPGLSAAESVSGLTGAEVPLRNQRILNTPELKISRPSGLLRIEGLKPLTLSLQQPDLTVREQRMILAEVVGQAVEELSDEDRVEIGPVRIFGPGQQSNQADFEHLTIAREAEAENDSLPVPSHYRDTIEQSLTDQVLRDLLCCEADDFPVFWDVRNRMKSRDLADRLERTGVERAGLLNMNRLTIVERGMIQ